MRLVDFIAGRYRSRFCNEDSTALNWLTVIRTLIYQTEP
jgi:hypothetical protein